MSFYKYYIIDKKFIYDEELYNKIAILKISNFFNDVSSKEIIINILMLISLFPLTEGMKFLVESPISFANCCEKRFYNEYICSKIHQMRHGIVIDNKEINFQYSNRNECIYHTLKRKCPITFLMNVEFNEEYTKGHFLKSIVSDIISGTFTSVL